MVTVKVAERSIEMEAASAIKKINEAKELISSYDNWITGAEHDGRGRHCMIGAMKEVNSSTKLINFVNDCVREFSGNKFSGIVPMNDTDGRTKAGHKRVLDAFDFSINKLKKIDTTETKSKKKIKNA